jgi:hypothetical protein
MANFWQQPKLPLTCLLRQINKSVINRILVENDWPFWSCLLLVGPGFKPVFLEFKRLLKPLDQ